MAHPSKDTTDDDRFLPAAQVFARYGVSSMSVYRWLRNPKLGFPKPVYIGRYRFWRLSDLVAWERNRATEAA
jgi:predicted DNA-binding transcriptional regulator AlpA